MVILASTLFVILLVIAIIVIDKKHDEDLQIHIQAAEQPLIEQIEKMSFQMRSHSHDFHNHVEVLQGLLEDDKYEEAKLYMESIHTAVGKIQSRTFPFQQPIVNALLQAKTTHAAQQGIDILVTSNEAILFPQMMSYDMVRLLGNLIDNAIEELEDVQTNPKTIEIIYTKKLNIHILSVINNGPPLSDDQAENMFTLGYSTKEHHQGTGLASVKNIVEHYLGQITVFNKEEKVTFQIAIPE
ncbi:GHKL domain-containing protein [Bacillus sp. 31A1R]|uniref:GHKL domain-containing protein n=1 Tax=Robertmurraya mangrovi TaxID=3098077 RepID=A0ABU5IYM9_9BACI|nr:GHKL domain-containing protein [Bacillus sp. 31A1R]MDZ5472195.1 GHKL domain-containing protein [Bacillus sp. 31A1R]